MKINHPVTDREVIMKKGTILVTRTNLKGIITHANDEFVEISGFSRDELIDSNHNMVRHPDMPPAVFKDLWECLKSGRPWTGLIKNRTKTGDFYWVDANVTPVFKKGRLNEFLSVRYAPSREQIIAAETQHQTLTAEMGTIRPKGIAALIKNIRELAIWKKATLTLVALMIPIVYLLVQLYRAQDWGMFMAMLLVSGVAVVISVGLIKQYVELLEESIGIFYRMAENRFRNKIELNRNDQIGDFHRALYGMQVKLNADLAHSRQVAADSLRIKQALDNVDSCVMVANKDLDIIYMNDTVKKMFKDAEADIRQQLPKFAADRLMGANIDQFHQNPSHQRGLLSRLERSFSSSLVIGNRHMDIVTNPVRNEEGERIGIVVEWVDRTHEVRIEQEIGHFVDSVKSGQLGKRIELTDKTGFFATLSSGINELADVIEEVFGDIGSSMQAMANGDLSNSIDREYQGVYLTCKNDINATIDKLAEIYQQINESAGLINSSSQEIASGNNDLSQRAELQASSMAQLTSTVANNADNAQQANRLANSAREHAEKGGKIVSEAVTSMQHINESSNKIAQIISVIDDIAFQTNLLALNASVEAARAGEHGRGFSVVATEVRNLAQRSATAARESKALIQTSVQQVRAGTNHVNETGSALREIVGSVMKVGDIVSEIAAASVEQSTGIGQVNQAISQLDNITQHNAALAEQASAASLSMSEQSDAMMRLLTFFNQGVPSASSNSNVQFAAKPTGFLDFALAKSKHLDWKSKLRQFLKGEQIPGIAQAVSHRDCDLGKWLHSSGLKQNGHLPVIKQLETLHTEFHAQMKACINHKQQGDHQKALQIYQTVSDLTDSIVELLDSLEPQVAAAKLKEITRRTNQALPGKVVAPYAGNLGLAEGDWEEF